MLCDLRQRFLFEVLPDIFPQGRLTEVEVGLWGLYYEQKNAETKHR